VTDVLCLTEPRTAPFAVRAPLTENRVIVDTRVVEQLVGDQSFNGLELIRGGRFQLRGTHRGRVLDVMDDR
jgi:hypothetical protein